ncbi:MAG: hypothetical protein AAF827_20070 [Cyanobacteria bacterium P01_D01_bin.6]
MDAGAGAGPNAAALTRLGHSVMAVEPLPDLLAAYRELSAWLNDSLPTLQHLGSVAA